MLHYKQKRTVFTSDATMLVIKQQTGKEKFLSLRKFDDGDTHTAYEQQQGICPICGQHFDFEKMHVDHITPWHAGGKTVPENLQMLCRDCNFEEVGAGIIEYIG